MDHATGTISHCKEIQLISEQWTRNMERERYPHSNETTLMCKRRAVKVRLPDSGAADAPTTARLMAY
jgi:hypothetical protein